MIMVLVVLMMVFGVQGAVSAAPADDIMTALKATDAPVVYFPQVEAYLKTLTISPSQATAVITHIQNADTLANGVTDFATINNTAQAKAILAEIVAAANILNLTVTHANNTLQVKDSSGQIVITMDESNIIKDTGHDYFSILAGGVLLAAAGVVALIRKKQVAVSRSTAA